MMSKNKLSVFDLFSGCGGLSIGLEQAGFNIKWANEIWEPAVNSYRRNHPNVKLYTENAREVLSGILSKDKNYPVRGEVDVITGGPPCQGFSGWNRHRSADDPRNTLVDVYFDIVACLKPMVAVMENVSGILSLENGKALKSILLGFEAINYQADVFIVQAGGYGLAQNRWRVFLVASRSNLKKPFFIEPIHAFPRTVTFNATQFRDKILKPHLPNTILPGIALRHLNVRDVIGDLPAIKNGEKELKGLKYCNPRKIQEYLFGTAPINDHDCIKLADLNMQRVMALPHNSGNSWVDLPEKLKPRNLTKGGKLSYDNRFGRLKWDGIFNTMVTKPDPYWGRFIHPDQDRVLSVRECARVQGFPDDVIFSGKLRERYMQIGNAVPPPLGRALGWSIRNILGQSDWKHQLEEYKHALST
jgi:DNA (cytosine-5)-methyltransferase 1